MGNLARVLRGYLLGLFVATSAFAQDDVNASRRTAIVRASERVAPAVVSVNVLRRQVARPRSLWESFFFEPGTRETQGLGSGFVMRADGIVLTNEHVVRGATEVVVTLNDGRDFPADIIGTDEITDLAVLKLRNPPASLPVAPIGTSANLIIGEWVIAIGNPFGFLLSNAEPTVTAGVVSGVGRNIVPGATDDERGYYLDMIQTDASINPGNSGGPLINAMGEVIGVNSSIISQSGGSVGLGFAIPIDRARRVADDLLAHKTIRRPWLGVALKPSEPNAFGRSREVIITEIAAGSPAARAGLRPGERIVSVAGRRVASPLDWEARMLDMRVGEAVAIVVRDGTAERTVRIVPGELPSLAASRVRAPNFFELVTVTPAIRAERKIRSEAGAMVVTLESQGRGLGMREGDVIVEVNRIAIETAQQAADAFKQATERGNISMTIERQGRLIRTSFTTNG